jgi:hypothetical protein
MPPSNTTPPDREAIQALIVQQIQDKQNTNSLEFNTQTNAKNAQTTPVYLSR